MNHEKIVKYHQHIPNAIHRHFYGCKTDEEFKSESLSKLNADFDVEKVLDVLVEPSTERPDERICYITFEEVI